jgi:Fe-S-cluster containining protein
MSSISDLYDVLHPLASQPECQTCRLCEEHVGLVYLLEDEASKLGNPSLPILTAAQDQYLGRTRDGWCCAFDNENNACKIYDSRPLCCRIYPLDLMVVDEEIWWVIHSECPIAQRFQRERRLGVLAALTFSMEQRLSSEQIGRWIKQDRLSQIIEAFSFDQSKVVPLRKLGEKVPFP